MNNLFKHELTINQRQTLVDITSYIKNDIEKSKIRNGIVL